MDINDIRTLIMVLSFVTFMGIVFWAYGGGRKRAFDDAAQLPFSEEECPQDIEGERHREVEGKVS